MVSMVSGSYTSIPNTYTDTGFSSDRYYDGDVFIRNGIIYYIPYAGRLSYSFQGMIDGGGYDA